MTANRTLSIAAAMAALLLFGSGVVKADDAAHCESAVEEQKWQAALDSCIKSAKSGNAQAQWNLAGILSRVKDSESEKAALMWYRRAAEQGHRLSQVMLGLIYSQRLENTNFKEAIYWYRLAAEQGDSLAHIQLGIMYEEGKGVVQDYVRAHMWFNIAELNNNSNSAKYRDVIAARMTREQIARAQEMARQCVARNYRNCD